MNPADLPADSKEGIAYLMNWARNGGWVLQEWHEAIAVKYGVPTEGVIISRPIPVEPSPSR